MGRDVLSRESCLSVFMNCFLRVFVVHVAAWRTVGTCVADRTIMDGQGVFGMTEVIHLAGKVSM